jgi:hypothetical protein
MKTDDLISVLSRQAEAVDPRAPVRRLLLASLLGVAAALPLMLWHLGINPDLAADMQVPMFWIKCGFVVLVAGASAVLVARLARPGVDTRRAAQFAAAPLLVLWGLAAVVLFAAAPAERMSLVMGSSWSSCALNIAMLSLPALMLLLAVVRTLAPTRLRQAGAATGLLAGALGTLAYLLHCPELEAPFLAIWYVLGMVIPAVIGAVIGPRVLRW